MNKKKQEKYFYQRWYFWVVLVTLLLLTGLLFLIKDTTTLSNILAFLSGWMGVLATIFIGVIATRQNKKYTEYSLKLSLEAQKTELKNLLNDEKKDIVEIVNNVAQYSKLTNMFYYSFDNTLNPNTKELKIKDGIDCLQAEIMTVCLRLQLLRYIPNTIIKIIDNVQELLRKIETLYKPTLENINDEIKFNKNITELTTNALSWIKKISNVRNEAVREINQKIEEIEKIDSMEKLYETRKEWLNKTKSKLSEKNGEKKWIN